MANYNNRYFHHNPSHRRQSDSRDRGERNTSGVLVLLLLALLIIGAIILAVLLVRGPAKDVEAQTQPNAASATGAEAATEPAADQLDADAATEAQATSLSSIEAGEAEDAAQDDAQAADSDEGAEAPSEEEDPEASSGSDDEADYRVLDGVPQTDRPLGLPECPQVDDAYFDDAVFIGDSVTLKLSYFVRDYREEYPTLLGKAQFLTSGSFGIAEAMRDVSSKSLHPSYQGTKMLVEDAVAAMGAKKVYIMLGMNDIAPMGPEECAKNMMRLAKRILDKSPNCKIYIQSVTPRIKGDYGKLSNDAIFQCDLFLYDYCQQFAEYGLYFVDVAYVMRDEEGNLPLNYCSDIEDLGIHFTDSACKAWIKYLYTHAYGV